MRWELVGDWERVKDEVLNGYFNFHGKKMFKGVDSVKGLEEFGFGAFKHVKFIADKGKRTTFEGPLK